MGKTSAKNKIIIVILVWVMASASMFFYFFNILDASNQAAVEALGKQKKDLAVLQSQKNSYEQSKADLAKLSKLPLSPDDFFSRDTSLVNQLQVLEDLNQKLGMKINLSGISGTIASEPKADTLTQIVQVPYSISVNGSLKQVTNFLEVLENLNFITNVSGISLTAADKNTVNLNLGAVLYLRY